MARSATPDSGRVREGGIRKRMRKGTHSCFECRRRKIRCIYSDDHPGQCTECFARGSKCVDQEHAESDAVVDNRKNLRERVAKLEALVEALLEDKGPKHAAEALRVLGKDITITPPSSDGPSHVQGSQKHPAPFLSMFNNDVLRRAEDRGTITCAIEAQHDCNSCQPAEPKNTQVYDIEFTGIGAPPSNDDTMSEGRKSKARKTRETLLSGLPTGEKLEIALTTNDDWWRLWRYKIPGIARGDNLQNYARRVITDGSPPEAAVLLLSVGIALDSDDLNASLALIDALIVSDDEYGATLQGLECTILMSKCYSEIGQPRRGWIAIRKGLAYAQILGLHRSHTTSQEWNTIWWALYTSDRFLSLLLGLPYGISDAHCDLSIVPSDSEGEDLKESTGKLAVLAGKVIDRTQGVGDLSFASALELDDELDAITSNLPEYCDEEVPLSGSSPDCKRMITMRERLLVQICSHQLRMYLHLPFMLKLASSSSSPTGCSKFEYSRTACFGASRKLLEFYKALRTSNGQPLYECKVIDFVGFTAAVLLFLGLLGYRRLESKTGDAHAQAVQDESDWRIIEITMDIFQRASTERGGKVAAQSLRVLQQLSKVRNLTMSGEDINYYERVAIPYFGTISVQRGKQFHHVAKGKDTRVVTNKNESPFQQQLNDMPPPATATGGPDAFDITPAYPGAAPAFPNNVAGQTPSNSTISTPPNPMVAYDPFVPSTGQWFFPGAPGMTALHGAHNHNTTTANANISTGMGAGFGGLGAGTSASWATSEDGLDNLVGGAPWMNSNVNMGLSAGAMDLDQDWAWFWGGNTTSEVLPR
ncbi:hypothetical protein BKA81DRAFT_408717 [Phyllosticta paracitricarpa]|uniref:Zn(2)-C6 fungal-type domain-containing protein n=1 Tax=Phyllosticta paracitricarpa TaxID=2016321 RepID=A0ABR1MVK7_9PEZI